MKTLPLRQLLRDPLSVKKLTRAGETVCITDGGTPLWSLSSAVDANAKDTAAARQRRRKAWEENVTDLLREPITALELPTLAEIVDESRGRF